MAPRRARSPPSSPSTSSARGEIRQAVHYWQQAGDNAAQRHAYHEAIAAIRNGLKLLATLPDSP